jgi:hypothetical protein
VTQIAIRAGERICPDADGIARLDCASRRDSPAQPGAVDERGNDGRRRHFGRRRPATQRRARFAQLDAGDHGVAHAELATDQLVQRRCLASTLRRGSPESMDKPVERRKRSISSAAIR